MAFMTIALILTRAALVVYIFHGNGGPLGDYQWRHQDFLVGGANLANLTRAGPLLGAERAGPGGRVNTPSNSAPEPCSYTW